VDAACGDVTTNSVEGFFGIFTRGLVGVYQHCGEQHLQRYSDAGAGLLRVRPETS
jgi:hypothetical protein